MTNPDYRHYVLIIDRSGSMAKIREDAQGGIRQFVKDQGELPGQATLSLYQFDTEHDTVYDFADLKSAERYTLVPRGGTALLDAVGFAVTQVGEKLAAMPEDDRPGKVIVLIVTDGDENRSCEYARDQVKALLVQQQDAYGWQVTYIGANVDAFAEAGSLGIAPQSALSYAATSKGTSSSYAAASAAVTRSVLDSSVAGISYTSQEREDSGQA